MPDPKSIVFNIGRGRTYALEPWPEVTEIADVFVHASLTGDVTTKFTWPYFSITVENGHAVYKLETCDQGRYRGELVESFFRPVT